MFVLFATTICAQEIPPILRTVSRSKLIELPSLRSGPIRNPVKCDASGALYFRVYQRGVVKGAPIIKASTRNSTPLVIDPAMVGDEVLPNSKTLQFSDFAVSAGTVYIAAMDGEQRASVLRFRAEDGKYLSATPLTPQFTPLQIAAFDSGAFVVAGVRKDQSTENASFQHYTALYDASGRFVKELGHIEIGAASSGGVPIKPEDMDVTTMALVDSSGSVVYFLQPSSSPVVYTVQESGAMDAMRNLWTPGEGFVPIGMRASGGSLLVEFVLDSNKDGTVSKYVVYDLITGRPTFVDTLARDMGPGLGCYDWQGGYTGLYVRSGHRALTIGAAR